MTARGPAPEVPAPVGFGSLISTSWWIVRSHFGALFRPLLVVVAMEWPAWLLASIVANVDPAGIAASFAVLIPLIVRVTSHGLGVALGAAIIADGIAGENASARCAVRKGRPLFKETLAASMFGALLAMVFMVLSQGLTLLLLPLFFGPPLIAQVIVLEAKPFQLATRRVREIGRGQLARIFGYLMAVALFIGLVVFILPRVFATSVEPLGDIVQLASFVLFSIVLSAIALAFYAAATTVAYFDIRARAEDYGLEELKAERGTS